MREWLIVYDDFMAWAGGAELVENAVKSRPLSVGLPGSMENEFRRKCHCRKRMTVFYIFTLNNPLALHIYNNSRLFFLKGPASIWGNWPRQHQNLGRPSLWGRGNFTKNGEIREFQEWPENCRPMQALGLDDVFHQFCLLGFSSALLCLFYNT